MATNKGNDAPLAAKGREFKGWLRVFEDPRLENRKQITIIVFLLLAIVAMALALLALTPLKETKPYFVESDGQSGAVAVSTRVAKEFTPDKNNIIYFIKLYVRNVLTVDSRLTTELYFPEAYAMSRGNAIQQLRQHIVNNKILESIADNPNLKRDVKLISLPSFISDKVVLARYQFTDGNKRYAMTIHYALIPPETDEDRLRNPIGFYVTDFVINEET